MTQSVSHTGDCGCAHCRHRRCRHVIEGPGELTIGGITLTDVQFRIELGPKLLLKAMPDGHRLDSIRYAYAAQRIVEFVGSSGPVEFTLITTTEKP